MEVTLSGYLTQGRSELKDSAQSSDRTASTISSTSSLSTPRKVKTLSLRQDQALIILDGNQERPYETVLPLSQTLGLMIDSDIARDDADKVAKAVHDYHGHGNILICWEHGQLKEIAKALHVKGYSEESGWTGKVDYPGDRFDLIWTLHEPYHEIKTVTSEGVAGLDKDTTGERVTQSDCNP